MIQILEAFIKFWYHMALINLIYNIIKFHVGLINKEMENNTFDYFF